MHPWCDLNHGLAFAGDDIWTPEQALAVMELLDDLRDRVWTHDGQAVQELLLSHPLSKYRLDSGAMALQNTHIDVSTKGSFMPATLSRVFMNGNSQAVRIPQEFRLTTNRVEIFRNADGDLVLHPVPADRGAALLDALKGFDDEFVALLEAGQREQLPMQDRESL